MDISLFIGIVGFLSIAYLLIGWYVSDSMNSHDDLFLAGRTLTTLPVTATLLATQIGGGMFIGTAQDPFRGMLYVLGIVFGFLILGMGVAQKFRAFNVDTLGGIFAKTYQSNRLKLLCEALSVATLVGILLSQAIATKSVITTCIGAEYAVYSFPLLWTSIVAYTLIGGLQAVVATDLIQVALIIAIFIGIFSTALISNPYSVFSLFQPAALRNVFSLSNLTGIEIGRILFVSTLYSVITQDIAQRFFASKNPGVAKRSAFYAGALLLAFAIIPFYFGLKAYALGCTHSESPLFAVLEKTVSGIGLVAALTALLAAITSTIDSLLCAVSSILCSLIAHSGQNVKKEISFSQKIILITGMGILLGSYFVPNHIISVLIGSYELSIVALFVPLMAACFLPKSYLTTKAAQHSIAAGLYVFALVTFTGFIGYPEVINIRPFLAVIYSCIVFFTPALQKKISFFKLK